MTGAYISHYGGKSRRVLDLRGVVELFVFDPKIRKTRIASTSRLGSAHQANIVMAAECFFLKMAVRAGVRYWTVIATYMT